MLKIIGYSFLTSLVFITFFYFYSAEIFEAVITESGQKYTLDVSLKSFLDYKNLPEVSFNSKVTNVTPTWKGALLLIICNIGIPIMIGYRIATSNDQKTT